MSTKKKPSTKSAADKGPQPLLKLKFEKFPDKPVAVYFETTKLCFYADFGFEQYESPSVPGLKQKIQAAIKRGVTPSPVWVPMIQIGINIHHGRTGYKQALDLNFDVDIDREYFCIGKGGKLHQCGWEVHERSRNKDASETYGALAQMKPRALNAPIFKRSTSSFDGGTGVAALIPYTDDLWRDLGEHVRELRAQAAGMIGHVVAGKLDVFTNFIFDFEASTRPAPKPAPKPAAKKAAPKSALLPFHEAAKKSVVVGALSKDALPHADFKLLDLVIDLPAGPVPAELLAAAGFPADTTARKESSGDFWVNSPGTGQVKCVPRAEMQKLIRDRINGQRGAQPAAKKAAKSKEFKQVLEAHGRKITDDALSLTHGKSKKSTRDRGDTTAREHLIVKYQGKQLTLGHGPLGNYLVEALRKTYPTIHSAYCLKDNSVQISLQGVVEPLTITGTAFETVINTPHQRGSLESFVNAGRNAQAAVDQVISTVQRSQGAIAKLNELVDGMQPEDPPLAIPSVILVAAGFNQNATGEIYSPQEILVRNPKKAVRVITLAELEQMILDQIKSTEAPEKELVGA